MTLTPETPPGSLTHTQEQHADVEIHIRIRRIKRGRLVLVGAVAIGALVWALVG